jgi:hypothetical protein
MRCGRTGEADVSDQPHGSSEEWDAFLRYPALYIDAARLDACFDGHLGAELCERLRGEVRLRDRLSAMVIDCYELVPASCAAFIDDCDRAIALSSAERLSELSRRAGAIFWARAIAGVILAAQVKVLHEQLGEPLYSLALTHQDLSGPQQPLEPIETIGARIYDDGWRCLAAWCVSQPEEVSARVRLKLAACAAFDAPTETPFETCGPAIVRAAAA